MQLFVPLFGTCVFVSPPANHITHKKYNNGG
jgi:hypothetical protein